MEQGAQTAIISPRQQLSYNKAGLGQILTIDPAEATSWQDGFIVFRYTTLTSAVAEINRYRPGKIILMSETLGQKTVSGRFQIERIDEVLTWIERATGASQRALPGGIVLLS